MIASELLLALLIVGLYLHDSATLLRADEAFLEKIGGRWRASFPSRRFTVLGKHVHFGGLLPPNSLVYRASWTMEIDAPAAPGWEDSVVGLRCYEWLSALLFALVMVLLPAALLLRAGDYALLALLGTTYVSIAATTAMLWVQRSALGITFAGCAKLSAEMVLCPPVAANLVRRLSLQRPVPEDFVSACRRLLPPAEWERATAEIVARLDDEIEVEGEGTDRYLQLLHRRATLT